MKSINPHTGRVQHEVPDHDAAEVDRRMGLAAAALPSWRRLGMDQRSAHLMALAQRLRATRERCARIMTEEMGKPIVQAEAEVDKCAWACEYFAAHGARYLEPEWFETDGSKSYVRYEPLGVVLAVMPWNFPFWQLFRAAAPALMAGNVVVLKHASNAFLRIAIWPA